MVDAARLRIVFFGTPDFAVPTLDALLGSRHTVVGVVVSSDGSRRVQQTAPVTFFVHHQSSAQSPVGPAQRPPPKPQPRAGNKMSTSQPSYAALNPVPATAVDRRTNRPVARTDTTSKPTTSRLGK